MHVLFGGLKNAIRKDSKNLQMTGDLKFLRISKLNDVPEDALPERQYAKKQGMKGFPPIPLVVAESVSGGISYSSRINAGYHHICCNRHNGSCLPLSIIKYSFLGAINNYGLSDDRNKEKKITKQRSGK